MAENLDGAYSEDPTGIERTHVRHEGLITVPTTTGGVRVIRLHQPYETEKVTFAGTKRGSPPYVPSHVAPDTNRIFLGGHRSSPAPMPTAALDSHIWTVTGGYEYVLVDNAGLNSAMPVAKLAGDPMENMQSPEDATIPAAAFVVGLLGKQEGYQ